MSRRRRLMGGGIGVGQGLAAWYDFTNAAYLTLSSTAITQALDRSGNGNNTDIQGTGTARPTFTASQVNGLPAAVFDGGDQLALPQAVIDLVNSANTIFVVTKRASEDATTDIVFSLGTGTTNKTFIIYAATAGRIEYRSNAGAGGNAITTGHTNTDFNIIKGRRSGTTQAISINGGTEVTGGTGDDGGTADAGLIGNSLNGLFLTGSIAEIIMYNRSLSAAESTQVELYLSRKYGITLT